MTSAEFIAGIESPLMAEIRKKSQNRLYQTDPEAWLSDVLGRKWWSKQKEIAWSFVDTEYTIVKSCNNIGKTQLAGDLVTWAVSVHPPTETIAMVSAPVRNQIDENMFRYLRENYNLALTRDMPLYGEITRWPKWVIHDPYDKDIVLPKRPADQNLVSSFQGVHQDHVFVVLDEAGGLQEDFYTGASAVTNNKHARILAIGNPDVINTAFHNRFKDRERYVDWATFSVKAEDTPNFTGEKIYPEDPELDEKIKGRLIQPKWVEMMRRSASPGVIKAKVDAEFPDENDNSFFTQIIINRSWETWSTMKDDHERPDYTPKFRYLGVDVAFAGEDKNVIYLNDSGFITKIEEWDKSGEFGIEGVEDMAIARRVHRWAQDLYVDELRIDAAGTSRGVHSNLRSENEFANRSYILLGIVGNNESPNKNTHFNARAWHYDEMRKNMTLGKLGLPPADTDLKTDLEVLTSKFNQKAKLQIATKAEIKKELKHSPDHLDAVLYASMDMSGFTDDPIGALAKGDTVVVDPWDEIADMAGMPM